MAKVERPLFSDEATGRVGQAVSFKTGAVWDSIIPQFHRSPTRSSLLIGHRAAYAAACAAWRDLTPDEKQEYKDNAPENWTGFQYYLNQTL